ncbi:phosphatase PAP2 family protein [Pyrococcus woesei]|uniref:phosphatase PAP2 family protein n=1 Tax=Pyrococcus woesei TaxID=2262 RepID=UPI003D2EBA5E
MLTILTAILLAIFVLQVLGSFSGINSLIDSSITLPTYFPLLLTRTADSLSIAAFVGIIVAYEMKKHRKISLETKILILSLLFGTLIVGGLKAILQVPRPENPEVKIPLTKAILQADKFAFPSGHTARASIFATYLSKKLPKFRVLWWAWAVGIALTRLILHVHWFSDVLFSLFLGPWVYLLTQRIFFKVER